LLMSKSQLRILSYFETEKKKKQVNNHLFIFLFSSSFHFCFFVYSVIILFIYSIILSSSFINFSFSFFFLSISRFYPSYIVFEIPTLLKCHLGLQLLHLLLFLLISTWLPIQVVDPVFIYLFICMGCFFGEKSKNEFSFFRSFCLIYLFIQLFIYFIN